MAAATVPIRTLARARYTRERRIVIIMPHSRGILAELRGEQAHREIAFCRLIIIQSFHHGLNRLMGRGTPTSRPENL